MMLRCVNALALLAVAVSTQVSPIEKVISLIEGMKKDVEDEGKAEAATYDKFACFCKDTTTKKAKSITEGQDKIDKLSASIAEKTATKASDETKLGELKTAKEGLSKDLEDTNTRCLAEKAEYEGNAADLNKAISSLKSALKAMSDKKKAMDAVALLDTGSGLRDTLNLAEAMGLIPTPKQKTVHSFLQQGSAVDPSDPDYKYHSSDIVDLLTSIHKDFKKEKETLDSEYGKTSKSCTDLKASLGKKLETNKDESTSTSGKISKLGTEIADDRGALVEAQDLMKDDEIYIKDLTGRCEVRATEWDQRSQMRSDEITALSTALKILGDKVKPADKVNERALLQAPASPAAPVAKKVVDVKPKVHAVTSFLQRAAVNVHELNNQEAQEKLMQEQAVVVIRDAGSALGSPMLSAMAMRIAADPFKKVKGLIQGLIERLIQEAAAEATKKGFCDTELGKARKDRDFRWTSVQKLGAEVTTLEAKEDTLTQEIDELTKQISSLDKTMKAETKTRKEEKAENAKTVETATKGLEAVNEALTVLRAFYKQAAKAAAFVQASPVDEDTEGAGFSGAYQGKQQSSNAVLDLLETIAADFDRTVRKTESMEKEAARDYVEGQRAGKMSLGGKTTKKELNSQDLVTTKNKLDKTKADLQTNMDLVDDAVKTLMELKPTCIDTGMSYADRVAKREEEVKALNKALCILDPNGVESACKK